MIRYSAATKKMLLTVLDYLASKGHKEARTAILDRLAISDAELGEWHHRHDLIGQRGLMAKNVFR